MGAGPSASLKGWEKFCTFGGGGLEYPVSPSHICSWPAPDESFRIVESVCGVQSILQVSEHPSLPAPSCGLLGLSLITLLGWPVPGLLWPPNNFTIPLSVPFLLSQTSLHKTQVVPATASSHDTRVYLVDNQELLRAGAMILLFLVTGQVQFLFHHVCLFYVAVARHPEPSAGSPAAEREAVTCWGSKVRNGGG